MLKLRDHLNAHRRTIVTAAAVVALAAGSGGGYLAGHHEGYAVARSNVNVPLPDSNGLYTWSGTSGAAFMAATLYDKREHHVYTEMSCADPAFVAVDGPERDQYGSPWPQGTTIECGVFEIAHTP